MATARYRLDDLRRFAAALGVAAGLAPARAAALATQLLWYDAAGAASLGIATLPDWLDRLDRGDVDPKAEGAIGPERAGTAVLDGKNGLPPLILARAAGLATEKARDVGVGLVRVVGIGPIASAAAVAAEVALGPEAAAVLGPSSSWAIALPSPEGLPLVVDPALDGARGSPPAVFAPLVLLAPEGGWLFAAAAIGALEPLATFHERLTAALPGLDRLPGSLFPDRWEASRRTARERGVSIPSGPLSALRRRAKDVGIPPPESIKSIP
ncbi:MAG TPA: Ldh family oxidoreductase [Isosphaeraceae bacterium]|nr:Ldh family oxidoreductase [Isosphaeraceae bacterium]